MIFDPWMEMPPIKPFLAEEEGQDVFGQRRAVHCRSHAGLEVGGARPYLIKPLGMAALIDVIDSTAPTARCSSNLRFEVT